MLRKINIPPHPMASLMVEKRTIVIIVLVTLFSLIGLFLFGMLSLFLVGVSDPVGSGNVALIPVEGVILTEKSSTLFGETSASSAEIVDEIEKADNDPSVKAIILQINSPGGSPVASDEITQAIKKTNKTTVAVIRDIGTSGAYWVASGCDQVFANRMSITGSIGVIASYLEYAGLMDRYNVSYRRLVSGKYKDIGSPYREMTDEELQLMQAQLDRLRDYFVQEVADNRDLPLKEVERLATGMFYLGGEAQELGLVDRLGGMDEAVEYIEAAQGIKVDLVEYRQKPTLLDVLMSAMNEGSFNVGRGVAYGIQEQRPKIQSLYV
jgi:protease IV